MRSLAGGKIKKVELLSLSSRFTVPARFKARNKSCSGKVVFNEFSLCTSRIGRVSVCQQQEKFRSKWLQRVAKRWWKVSELSRHWNALKSSCCGWKVAVLCGSSISHLCFNLNFVVIPIQKTFLCWHNTFGWLKNFRKNHIRSNSEACLATSTFQFKLLMLREM